MRRVLAIAAVLAFAGCMEVEQTVQADKMTGQTVKRDTASWVNAPAVEGPSWTKGDRTSWEEQIKRRQLAQHEDRRIYQ
jgi:hypothetical protein